MKNVMKNFWIARIAVLLMAASSTAQAQTNAAPAGQVSVFDDNSNSGKDPFFPKSKRKAKAVVVTTEPGKTEAPVILPINQLSLKGISGSTRKFALINNVTFAKGETSAIKTINGTFRVKCVEIKDKSVVVQINDDPKPQTLYLKEGF